MQDKTKLNLVSSEIAGLWNVYMNDTMILCMLKYFINRLEDEEIRPILQYAIDISNGHIQVVVDQFSQEGLPIPHGFKDMDVDINAPRLFTDTFYLYYLSNLAQYGMNFYALMLNHMARSDIRDFFSKCLIESIELINKIADTLQQQGVYIRAPRVEFSKEVDYIDNQNYFSGGLLGKKRPLTAREITFLFASIRYDIIGSALITGFGQVTSSKKLNKYFFKGRDIANNNIEILTDIFIKENVPIPSTSDAFITNSTISPFSDKFMLNHILILYGSRIGLDGVSLSYSLRHDLQAHFFASMAKIATYGEDGLDILVENRWMETPPQIIVHKNLAKD